MTIIRTAKQDELLAEDLIGRIRKDRLVFKYSIKPRIKAGKILECGCGNGIILELLSKEFKDSTVVGTDVSERLLGIVEAKRLKNVVTLKANAIDDVFPSAAFNTVIFHKSLHEVECFEGRSGTIKAIKNAYKYLQNNGVLIVRENLKPSDRKVCIRLKSSFARERLKKFAADFSPTKVKVFSNQNDVVELSEHVAMEYITKYDERDWATEMKEPHFFFKKQEWEKQLSSAGFRKVDIHTDTINQLDIAARKQDFELLFPLPIYRATIVARK